MASYPPTSEQIMAGAMPPQPPSYEDSIRPEANTRPPAGKPERPAPPYCAVEQVSRPAPSPSYPATSYPNPGGFYPTRPTPQHSSYHQQPDRFDQQRTIVIAPPQAQMAQQPPYVTQPVHQAPPPNQPAIVTGQCQRLETWLASKTGMRSCLVTVIMCFVLMIVCWIIGITGIGILFIVVGLTSAAFLVWSVGLRRQMAKRAQRTEREGHLNRVEIRPA